MANVRLVFFFFVCFFFNETCTEYSGFKIIILTSKVQFSNRRRNMCQNERNI